MKLIRKLKIKLRNKPKVFVIGFNKTGTTSLKVSLLQLGFIIGDQKKGERQLLNWSKRNFKELIDQTHYAEAFQDVPYSLPYTYIALHQHYPDAKFILTVRNSSEDWYKSICKFHSKLWGKNGELPTISDLKDAKYVYKGMAYDYNQLVFGNDERNPYEKKRLINVYEQHNSFIEEYFRNCNNFIKINLSNKEDYKKLCTFLNVKPKADNFKWLNKS